MFLLKIKINFKILLIVIICSLPLALFTKMMGNFILYHTDDYDHNVGIMLVSLKKLEVYQANKIIDMNIDRKTIFNDKPTNITLIFDYFDRNDEEIKEYYKKQSEAKNWLFKQIGDEIIMSKKYGKDNILLTLKPEENKTWAMKIVNIKK